MNKDYDYKRLTPFKWFVLQNFPFIDEDFDAITNYQLFCKLGEEINKVITSTNAIGTQLEELTEYVENYFDNLDVQEEINNKLDEMAEDGTLEEIISEYINLKSILAYNTKTEMKSATNLIDGSFTKTYGNTTLNDRNGAFYKIREIRNTDIVDDNNIVALTNYPELIAEKIREVTFSDLNELKETIDSAIAIQNANISNAVTEQNQNIAQATSSQNENIATLESRMDTFTNLSEGSTTGDAELQDIRVAFNGYVYDSAGTSVRKQTGTIAKEMNLHESINIFDPSRSVSGRLNSSGQNEGTYGYTIYTIDTVPGDVLRFYKFNSITAQEEKASVYSIVPYTGATQYLTGYTQNVDTYTVPANITSVKVSIITGDNKAPCCTRNNNIWIIGRHSFEAPFYEAKKLFDSKATKEHRKPKSISVSNESVSTSIALPFADAIQKNKVLTLSANVSSFTKITIERASGGTIYGNIAITATKIIFKSGDTTLQEFEHGLTILNNITVIIKNKTQFETNPSELYEVMVTLISNGEKYDTEYVNLGNQARGVVTVVTDNTTLNNFKMDLTCKDFDKKILVIGDSYTLLQNDMWTEYLAKDGFLDNIMLIGFPGAQSYTMYTILNNLIEYINPSIVLWTIGMNDADSSTIVNGNWIIYTGYMTDLCYKHGIETILSLLPSTPERNNYYKNQYVTNSGYKYVDFATMVNGNSAGSTWYSGMLSNDDIHPTVKGAKALYSAVIKDFPEITQ